MYFNQQGNQHISEHREIQTEREGKKKSSSSSSNNNTQETMEKVEEVRKGPWTEQEDVQLVLYVNLFGDRRWDFIAKVSGLKRSGKSCRLRWVNYLHPGLKRGKMTAHEERLVLELHNKWGNRWSKIARKLPGRTDNEIKNYWRTLMRKKAQEKKKSMSSSSSTSSLSSSSESNSSANGTAPLTKTKEPRFYDSGGVDLFEVCPEEKKNGSVEVDKACSMDEMWKEFEFSQEMSCSPTIGHTVESPVWDYCRSDTLWSMDEEEESKLQMMMMMEQQAMGHHHFYSFPFNN